MTLSGTYDVIIAGAGPAGSTVAYILASSGLRVLLVDKERFPRKKVCGGLITFKTVRLLERVFGITARSLGEHGILNYESGSFEIRDKRSVLAAGSSGIPFRFIDRERYDAFLLGRTRESGVAVLEGDRIASINVLKRSVTTASGREFISRVTVGADGVNSRVRRSFPTDLFGRESWKEDLASAHEVIVPRGEMKTPVDHPVLYYDFIDYGYAWVFPNREHVVVGMCGLKRKNQEPILTAFREFLGAIGIQSDQRRKIFSYVLPYGNFLPEPVFRHILLVGDAAGFADPLLGEGIYYAQRSAELAAEAIKLFLLRDENHAVLRSEYLRRLRYHIYPELVYAGKIQETLFQHLRIFRWLPLKILMALCGNRFVETIHGLRSYRWMKKRTDY